MILFLAIEVKAKQRRNYLDFFYFLNFAANVAVFSLIFP